MHPAQREPTLLEEGWSLLLAAADDAKARDRALRIAIAFVEADPLQLNAAALLTRLAIATGKNSEAVAAAGRLVDA